MTSPTLPKTMRAMPYEGYGTDQWKPVTVPVPEPAPDRFLVEIRAASINPAELHELKGGFLIRALSGFKKPTAPAPGTDMAGVVVAAGADATGFSVGDQVFGAARGALAEYGAAKFLAHKPESLSWEEAASIPIAGMTALQGLRDKGELKPGQSVLINGASGGVGTFAVQIAKALGAEVTGVCGSKNIDLVTSLGAVRVIDYTTEDFTKAPERYDLVFDVVGNRSLRDLRRVLKPNGILVLCGGGHQNGHGQAMMGTLLKIGRGWARKKFRGQRIAFYIAKFTNEDLATVARMVEEGKLKPIVDRTYTLDQTAEAFRYLRTGHAKAKIVITMSGQ